MTDIIVTPIVYSEVFGIEPTFDEFSALVSVPEWKLLASRCIGIAAISWKDGVEDPAHQMMLVREFARRLVYGPVLESRLRSESSRRLYTTEALLAILRVAVVSKTEPGATLSNVEFADIFHKAVLMANELIVNELSPAQNTKSAQDFLATELRSILAQHQNPHDLIARTAAMFDWSESARATAHGPVLPLRADFQRFTALSPEEYAAAAYLALGRTASMRTWDEVTTQGVAFSPSAWLASQGITQGAVALTWLNRHTTAMAAARASWSVQKSLSLAGAGPIWKTPMVRDDDDLLFLPSPFFVSNMLGDGTYFELFDGYKDRNTVFSTFFGHFFQDYVEDRFRRGYAARPNVGLWADEPYSGGRSSDVIILEGNDVIFVEVVAKRMQLVGSVLQLDQNKIMRDLRLGVIEKLQQLQENINAFRGGTLLPEITRVQHQKLYPILVAPREWPRMYVLSYLLNTAPLAGLLADCEPIELLDVAEVEDLEGRLALGLSLAQLLKRKNKSSLQNRVLSMHNYLTVVEPGTYPITRSPTRVKGDELALQLIELAKTWA